MKKTFVIAFSLAVSSALPAVSQERGGMELSYDAETPNVVPANDLDQYAQFIVNEGPLTLIGNDGHMSIVSLRDGEEQATAIDFNIGLPSINNSNFYDAPGFMVTSPEFDHNNGSCVLFQSHTINVTDIVGKLDQNFARAVLSVAPTVLDTIAKLECFAFERPKPGVVL